MSERRPRRLAAVGLLALVAFGTAFAEASFVHTDDGCAVEVHCLACRWTVGTTAVAAPVFSLTTVLAPLGAPPESPATPRAETTPEAIVARGPPLA